MKLFEVYQFLLEYDAEKTWASYGPKILDQFKKNAVHGGMRDMATNNPDKIKNTFLKVLDQADPTPNKQYAQWLARMFANGTIALEDMTERANAAIARFDLLKQKNKLQPEEKDINRIKSYKELEALNRRYQNVDVEGNMHQRAEKQAVKDAEVFFDGKEITIYHPKTYDAAKQLADGTDWCTQYPNNYRDYAKQGKLYVIVPKDPDYDDEKYQFHFESDQFMDISDEPISKADLVKKYPEIKIAFNEIGAQYLHPDFTNLDLSEAANKIFAKAPKIGNDMWVLIGRGVNAIKILSKKYSDSYNNYADFDTNGSYIVAVNGDDYSVARLRTVLYSSADGDYFSHVEIVADVDHDKHQDPQKRMRYMKQNTLRGNEGNTALEGFSTDQIAVLNRKVQECTMDLEDLSIHDYDDADEDEAQEYFLQDADSIVRSHFGVPVCQHDRFIE